MDLTPPSPIDESIDVPSMLLASGFNVVLHMATGSGKTHRARAHIASTVQRGLRAIYVTPTKALAEEVFASTSATLTATVGIFTSDHAGDSLPAAIAEADVLIMTPERLDLISRHWRRHWSWLPSVGTLVVDELHLLADPQRGPRLEATLLRMQELNPMLQIVGLSATLGNASELASWLSAALFEHPSRAIPLVWSELTFSKATEKPEKLTAIVSPCVKTGGRSIVFAQSRRKAEQLALDLTARGVRAEHHHGGLAAAARKQIEARFRAKEFDVLVATATLEVGLNLPVRQVVLYDIQQFDQGAFRPLTHISAWQRAGRAGRPGHDDSGEAVVFRARWEASPRYERGQFESIRSSLGDERQLTEQILVTIAGGYARNTAELQRFFARSLAHHQQRLPGLPESVKKLISAGFLTEEESVAPSEARLFATPLGHTCSRLMLGPETMLRAQAALAQIRSWTLFDLTLLACTLPDADASMPVDFEELDALGALLQTERSAWLCGDPTVGPPWQLVQVSPKRFVAGIKAALVLAHWFEEGDMESVAEALNCYPADVRRLIDSVTRILSGLSALAGLTAQIDTTTKTLQPKLKALQKMVELGLDSSAISLTLVPGLGSTWARRLLGMGIRDIEDLAQADADSLQHMGRLSKERAQRWIDAATELMNSDEAYLLVDASPLVAVSDNSQLPAIDFYRFQRSHELMVEAAGDGCTFHVSGGRDPHLLLVDGDRLKCDCLDASKGHICKHQLAVRRYLNDPLLEEFEATLTLNNASSQLNLRAMWAH